MRAACNRSRILTGAYLRKLGRGRDLRARITALLALIDNAEAIIARCAKRLKAGVGGRGAMLVLGSLIAIRSFLGEPLAFSIHCADTS